MVEGDCALAEVERGEEEGAVLVPFQVEVPACEVPSSWEVGEVPARGVRNSEEAGLLGSWG